MICKVIIPAIVTIIITILVWRLYRLDQLLRETLHNARHYKSQADKLKSELIAANARLEKFDYRKRKRDPEGRFVINEPAVTDP
jgi:hypothetical protein